MDAAARTAALRNALMAINSLFYNREEFDMAWPELAIALNDYAEEALLAGDVNAELSAIRAAETA